MPLLPAEYSPETLYYDNIVDINDEIGSLPIEMEVFRKAVRFTKNHSHKKDSDMKNVSIGRHHSLTHTPQMSDPRTSRSFSVDLGAMTTGAPFLHKTPSQLSFKHVSFDADVFQHETEIFPFDFSKNRKESMDSLSSEETFDSQHSVTEVMDSFHVRLFNKFGTLADSIAGIKDAKSVSHIYKGGVLVADILDSKVVWFERSGKALRTFMTKDTTEPWGAVMTPGGHVAVTLRRQRCVALWSNDGQSMMELGHGLLKCPAGVAVDKSGRLFVADEGKNDVLAFDQTGKHLFSLATSPERFKQPRYVVCSNSGNIIVADSGNHCIKVFDDDGQFLFKFGSYGQRDGQFKFPYGVCVDQHDNIFVADHYNDRIVMFSSTGEYLQTIATSASGLKGPSGVAIRCTHNRKLYVTHGGLRSSEVVVFNLVPIEADLTVSVKNYV